MDDLFDQLQQTFGSSHYTINRELRAGGMARVFVAHDEALGREIVVKVLPPELTYTFSAARFAREIKLAAALQEPHILPVLTAGQTAGGYPYYTMPFVRGESLRERIRKGPVPLEESLAILRGIGDCPCVAERLWNLGNLAFRQRRIPAATSRPSLSTGTGTTWQPFRLKT